MPMMRLEFRLRQDLLPLCGTELREGAERGKAAFERGAVRIVPFEMIRVDFNLANASRLTQPQDQPVVSGPAPPLRLPAVTHVGGAPGHDHVVFGPVMHVAG